jgi:hypothetical protein
MAGKGGARPGSGRPTLAKELGTADLAREVLIAKYGGLHEALEALIDMNEPALHKFVYEHAFGKPTEKVQHSGEITQPGVGLSDSQFDKLIDKINANSTS